MIDTFPEARANATLTAALLDAAAVTQRDGYAWMTDFFTNASFPKCEDCATPGTGPGWDLHLLGACRAAAHALHPHGCPSPRSDVSAPNRRRGADGRPGGQDGRLG